MQRLALKCSYVLLTVYLNKNLKYRKHTYQGIKMIMINIKIADNNN